MTRGASLRAHRDPVWNCRRFFTEYINENGRHTQIIGEISINGSVKFIGISEIWVSGFPYIANFWAHVESIGWVSSGVTSYNGNPGSTTITESWVGIFAHSTVNWSENWNGSVNASPADLPRSPICPHVARRLIHEDFLNHRRNQNLWRQSNCGNTWVNLWGKERDFSDGLETK